MALTLEEELALKNASLVKFFGDSKDGWQTLAQKAYDYTKDVETPNAVRTDDVIKVLEPALSINPALRKYLAENHLNQKYWFRRFGNLVLDRCWTSLEGG